MSKPKIIVICGPTASGKTALSIQLAKKINGEIISADSMQIYDEMDIGTAKPTIEEILKKGKTPIIVGGTGLYVDSLVQAIEYDDIEVDLDYRKKLDEIANEKGLEVLYEQAMQIDSEAMQKISKNDKKRIFRVLEIYNATGKTKTEQEKESRKKDNPYEYIVFAIDMQREKLYERINKRVDIMLDKGLVNEVKDLTNKYKELPTAIQGLGYKEVVQYLKNELTYIEMVEKIKQETRRYAKRQLTWFRRNKQITWLNGLDDIQNNINVILEGVTSEKKK